MRIKNVQELVFKHAGVGQRSAAAYEIVRIQAYGHLLERGGDSREPFRDIDWRTVINVTRKQIILEGSNGACDSTAQTYYRNASGGMSMTDSWRSVVLSTGDCDADDYAVENQVNRIGQTFKSEDT